MARKDYPLNGPAGTALTTANTGATQVNTSGGTAVYATAAGNQLATGAQIAMTNSTGAGIARLPFAGATATAMSATVVFSWAAVGSTGNGQNIISFRNSGSALRVAVSDTRALVVDSANTYAPFVTTAGGSTEFVPTPGTKYRVTVVANNTAAVGSQSYSAKLYTATGTTPIAYAASTTATMRDQSAWTAVDLGIASGAAANSSMTFAEVGLDDGNTSELGQYTPAANSAPSVTTGAAQTVTAGTTVNLTSTATDTDGTIKTRAWTVDSILPAGTAAPAITGSGNASASFTPTVPGVYVLRHTATDDGNASGSATTTVYVQHTAETGWQVADVTASGWTTNGAAGSMAQAMNDADAATSITSPVTTSTATFQMTPITPRTSLSIPVSVVVDSAPAAGESFSVALVEGSTTRKTQAFTPTTSAGTATLTGDSSVCSAISDWTRLKVVVTHTVA